MSLAVAARAADPAEPKIPAHLLSLSDYGAVADGKTVTTGAFTKAIAAIKAAGGGTLNVPAGTYLTGPFQVTNNMELHLEKGAIIKATERFADYGLPDPLPADQAGVDRLRARMIPLISGEGRLDNFVLSGEGTIDGSGEIWWQHVNKPTYFKAGNLLLPRPRLIAITARNMAVRGVTLTNSPSFHLVPTQCESLLIEDVHIIAPERAPNTDAIDPSGCKNVVIRKCTLDVGDDDVAIKAGGAGACTDIEITDCTIKHGHGISIGSETYAGVKDMTVRNCTFDSTTPALRIKSGVDRGGNISDILYEHITMKNVSIAVELNMVYDATTGGNAAGGNLLPHLNGVVFKDITATNAKQAMKIVGLPQAPIENVRFENVTIDAGTGMSVEEAKGIVLKNVNVTVKQGEALVTKNADVKCE